MRSGKLLKFALPLLLGALLSAAPAQLQNEMVARPAGRVMYERVSAEMLSRAGFDPADSAGLFIGINDFKDPNVAQLRFAVDDAVDLAYMFVEMGLIPAQKVKLAISGDTAKPESQQRLLELRDKGVDIRTPTIYELSDLMHDVPRSTGPNGMLVVHICSHGFDEGGVGMIMVADSNRSNLKLTAIPVNVIQEALRGTEDNPTRAKRRLIFIDACRNKAARPPGSARDGVVAPSIASDAFIDAFTKSEGQATIFAADVGRYSYEDPIRKQGVFTHYLMEGMRGGAPTGDDDLLSLSELAAWVGVQVDNATRTSELPQIIRPEIPQNAAEIPLAYDPRHDELMKELIERRNVALRYLSNARDIDRELITGTMEDEIWAKAKVLEAKELTLLIEQLETLQFDNPGVRKAFVTWWSYSGRDLGGSSATPSPTPRATEPPRPTMIAEEEKRPPTPDESGPVDTVRYDQGMRLYTRDGREYADIDLGGRTTLTVVKVPAGNFYLGATAEELGFFDEGPRKLKNMTSSFWMSEAEITSAQFAAFVAANPGYRTLSEKRGFGHGTKLGDEISDRSWQNTAFNDTSGDIPAVYIAWQDAKDFCNWITKLTRLETRLPSEAEWEYACRAGSEVPYPWGTELEDPRGGAWANVADQSALRAFDHWTVVSWDDGQSHIARAKSYRANAFGLYDMTGNVWEWCEDLYNTRAYSHMPEGDPIYLRGEGTQRVIRGGSWSSMPSTVRTAARNKEYEEYASNSLGFRIRMAAK